MINVELKVNELEFKGTINKPSEEAQALFSSILASLFEQPKAVEENKPKVVLQDKVNTPFTYHNPIKPTESVNKDYRQALTEPVKRKLLVGKCECGERHYIWVYDNGRPFSYICKKCEKKYVANYDDLILAHVSCKGCGNRAFTYVNNTKDLDVDCRECGSQVNLRYNKSRNCMDSL